MRTIIRLALINLLLVCSINVVNAQTAARAGCAVATDAQITKLFDRWNLALSTLDSAKVVDLYWTDAVLLPTVSNLPRTNTALIKDYFDHFLEKTPRGRIDQRVLYHGCNVSLDMGLYTFSLMDSVGAATEVHARYTFIYTFKNNLWKIQHHHSSAMPELIDTGSSASSKVLPLEASKHSTIPTKTTSNEARLQRVAPFKVITDFISDEMQQRIGTEVVALRICATDNKQRSYSLLDPSPKEEANKAALQWAQSANWVLQDHDGESYPLCTNVLVRFKA